MTPQARQVLDLLIEQPRDVRLLARAMQRTPAHIRQVLQRLRAGGWVRQQIPLSDPIVWEPTERGLTA